jgi:hypothetical protein
MQFQYQEHFKPVFVPTAAPLPIIVEPCLTDWIEPPAPIEVGFQQYNVTVFAEYDGITIFDDNSSPVIVPVLEQYESFSPIVIAAPAFVKNWDFEHVDSIEAPVDYSDYQSVFQTLRPLPIPGIADKLSLIEYYNLTVRLDVKKAVDSGVVVAVSTDVSGTPVLFNKSFKDIDSIVATVQEVNNFQVVIDFVDIPNPTGFSVYVFNAAGTRVTKTVYWVARGII